MLEKYEVCCGLFHGFDWSKWISGTPTGGWSLLPAAQEHILLQEDGKARCLRAVTELTQAFALAVPHEEALKSATMWGSSRRCGRCWQRARRRAGRSPKSWSTPSGRSSPAPWSPIGVIDIFAAAGLKKPDISILSDEFLAEVRGMPQRNLAVELLQKLLKGEIRARSKQATWCRRVRSPRCWKQAVRKYQNRAIETAQVIEELIAAREGHARRQRAARR
jgi:type I restriction enzyme R subunit